MGQRGAWRLHQRVHAVPHTKTARELTIRAKVLTAFLALSATTAFVGSFGLYATRALTGEVRRLAGDRIPAIEGLSQAQNAIPAVRLGTAQAIDDTILGKQTPSPTPSTPARASGRAPCRGWPSSASSP